AKLFNIDDIKQHAPSHIAETSDPSDINHQVGGMNYVFNLAANVSHLDSMFFPQHDLKLNCQSQLTLLKACRNFNPHVKIVYTSTRQVYGKPLYLPLDEQHRCAA